MASIGVKAIGKPKFNAKAIERAILREKRDKGRDIEKQLEKTVVNWSGVKPAFKARVKDRGKDVVIETTLTGAELTLDKWQWLDEGTPEHRIFGSPRLAFDNTDPKTPGTSPYGAATKPRSFSTSPKVLPNPFFHQPTFVKHPGFPAREWTKMIREWMEKEFGKRIQVVLKRVIERG